MNGIYKILLKSLAFGLAVVILAAFLAWISPQMPETWPILMVLYLLMIVITGYWVFSDPKIEGEEAAVAKWERRNW